MSSRPILALLLLMPPAAAGCLQTETGGGAVGPETLAALGFDGTHWPDLSGHTVRVLAYDAFSYAWGAAEEAFENATGAEAEVVFVADSGRVLERAVLERGNPSFDVLYGIDNVLLARAAREDVFEPYRPLLADRIPEEFLFAPGWLATPVNHGYVAVNVDPREGLEVEDLDDVREHADGFVAMDPRFSTPGLGFLLATIATYGEGAAYDWKDYWTDLLAGGAVVAPDWTEGYANRFSGGYGQFEEGTKSDKPIVVSYTTSPAYEMYYGYDRLNDVVLAPKSTFHQVQLMGIARGTDDRLAAEAWIEFCLTDAFQSLAAEYEAIYPVVANLSTEPVFQGRDPEPGTFEDAALAYRTIDANVARWLAEWEDLYQRFLA